MERAGKILVVAPAWIGDMVLSQSLYKALGGRGDEVHVLAPAWSHAVLARMPEVSKSFETPAGHGELKFGARRATAKILQRERYDRAIVLPRSFKAALIPYLARIPVRTGYCGEMRYGLLNDVRFLGRRPPARIVDRYVNLAPPRKQRGGRPQFDAPAPALTIDEANARACVKTLGLALDSAVVAMMPGAAFGPSKQWPPDYFAEVAARFVRDGFQVWLLGSPADRDVGDKICAELGGAAHNLCGRTKLADVIDLLALADKAVTNDSGLMHIAAAVGCPVVAVYGATSVDYTPPMLAASKRMFHPLKCSPCWQKTCRYGHYKCLTEVKPAAVYQNAQTLKRGA